MRPTGRLHLGHYFGALQNWLKLQEEYECFFFVADWHALTTHYEDTSSISENTLQVAMDWLSVGLDPGKSTLFVQSSILEHAELYVLLSMITPLSWLERVPTYKEQIENLKDRDLGTYGFLGYPLLQAADIVIYDADFVPVGEDQVPHVELTREIVRRFNATFAVEIKESCSAAAKIRAGAANQTSLTGQLGTSANWDGPQKRRSGVVRSVIRKTALRRIGIENFLEQLGAQEAYEDSCDRGFCASLRHLLTANAAIARNRRPPHGEKLRQRDLALRSARRDSHKSPQHDHGPAAPAPDRSWPPRSLPRFRMAQIIFAARDDRLVGPRLPHRRHRLHRMQSGHGG